MKLSSLSKIFVSQRSQSDCGAACMLMILKHFGGDENIQKIRELSGTTSVGTSLMGLKQASEELGIIAEGYEADIHALMNNELPCILHVQIDNLTHYVVCWGYLSKEQYFVISDPEKGVRLMTADKLEGIWKSRKLLLIEGKTDGFNNLVNHSKNKRKLFGALVMDDRIILVSIFITSLLFSFLQLTLAIFPQILIDDILPEENIHKLMYGFAVLTLLLLFKSFIGFIKQLFVYKQSFDFGTRIVNTFYGRLLNLPKPFFGRRKSGEIIA